MKWEDLIFKFKDRLMKRALDLQQSTDMKSGKIREHQNISLYIDRMKASSDHPYSYVCNYIECEAYAGDRSIFKGRSSGREEAKRIMIDTFFNLLNDPWDNNDN